MQGLPNVGDVLDETYRIEELIGQGGFGAVYLARQMSMDRQVAIKVLVAHAMNVDEMIERFRREVMAVRNLSHPNTIRIYDFRGDREDGMLYYVMEFVKGSTLKDLIKDAPISIKRVKHILRQILKSLSEAHSYGIVHRDLKPANIMLADLHGETDFVKVVDFGIAKIMNNQENDDDADPLTSAGVLVGTLRYMAPEQITGQGIGPQSDLYALGLIAIEMLTGKSVFEGTGRWEVLHKQISDDPVDIPNDLIQSEIGKFLTTALEKRLEMRYKTADEMLAALDAVPDGTPMAAAATQKPDDATQMAPLPAVMAQPAQSQPDPTGVVSRAKVDDDATQISELPSESMRPQNVAQVAARPIMQTNPTLSAVEDYDEPAKKPPYGVLGAIGVLILIALGGVGYVVTQGSTPAEEPKTDTEVAVVTQTAEQPTQPVVAEPKVEEPKPEDPTPSEPEAPVEKWVRFATPGVKARVFKGESFIGETPVRVQIKDGEQWSLRANGYLPQLVTVGADTPEELAVELERMPKDKPTDKPDDIPTDKPADKPADAWADITAKPKDKPADKPDSNSTSDWVDVKKPDKPKVPLF